MIMGGLFKSENLVKGKGFFDGLEVEITDAGYAEYDAEGKWKNSSVCFFMEMDAEKLNDPAIQYWSIGNPTDFKPTEDGNGLLAEKGMSERCNMAYLTKSLENAGMPEEVLGRLDEDASLIVGYKFRMTTTFKNKADKYGTPTVDEILGGPEAPVDVDDTAAALVKKIVSENGDSVAIKSLPKLIGAAVVNFPDDVAKEIRKTIMAKGFIAGIEGLELDGKNVVAA